VNPRWELLPAQVDAKDAPIELHACTLAWEGDMLRIHDAYWSTHNNSALFCEVRVSIVTGEIRVSRFLGSFNCGRILNAKTAASR
jgi:CO/xanthine dehydrogenase Mo-binding subunit